MSEYSNERAGQQTGSRAGESITDYTPYPDDYPLRQELIDYSHQIIDGEVVACQKHKWACERFLRDLEREGTDEFPYVFDESRALDFLNWMKLFKHRKGVLKGRRIEPHIIQKFVFGNIYGWIHRRTDYRRIRKAYWQVGRKNAKSQSLSCVGSYELMALGEGASEVYCAATKTEQAQIVWEETRAMLDGCAELRGKYQVAYSRILHPRSGSVMRALSKEDRKTGDGFNPQCGIVDEYHAHETAEIYDVLDSGMGARTQPLIMIITTAGDDLNNPCYRVEYAYVSDILNPNSPIKNDEYFVMINEMDVDDDGKLVDEVSDETAWLKANPIAASYPEGLAYLRGQLKAALDVPEKMRTFLTKNLNVWINERPQGYMNMAKWAACAVKQLPDLGGRKCYIGVDLSAKIDLASVAFEFPLEDGFVAILSHSFMPEDTLAAKRKTDKVPYDLWVKQGHITPIDGAVIDDNDIINYIVKRVEENGWEVAEVCFDQWGARQFANVLGEKPGYKDKMVEIVQGMKTLSEPTKDFRARAYQKKVLHLANPVFDWAMSNAVTSIDRNQNIMLDKSKARQRIDPVAAAMNSHVRAMVAQPKPPPGPQVLIF
jgi:phage terminase large subunit-like protein